MKSAEACLRSALFRFCGIGRSLNSEESHWLYELEHCETAGRRSSFSIWRFMLSRVRRTEKAYLLYQSEESHRLYELEHCELAGVAVSLLVIVY